MSSIRNTQGNTQGLKRTTGKFGKGDECHWTGGEDYLVWSAKVHWSGNKNTVFSELRRSQDLADRFRGSASSESFNVGDFTCDVFSRRYPLFKRWCINSPWSFCLSTSGIFAFIWDPSHYGYDCADVTFWAPGLACLSLGGLGCVTLGRSLVKALGGESHSERLRRVDMRLDLPGVGIDAFAASYVKRHFVTRAKVYSHICSTSDTLQFGKRPISLTIYDKAQDPSLLRNREVYQLVRQRCWGGEPCERATRVEFSLLSDFLKTKGILSPDDYFSKRADLVKYLCGGWFRFTDGLPGRGNSARKATLPLWLKVARRFLEWAGDPSGVPLIPIPTKTDCTALMRQAYGVIRAIALYQKAHIIDYTDFVRLVSQHIVISSKYLSHNRALPGARPPGP